MSFSYKKHLNRSFSSNKGGSSHKKSLSLNKSSFQMQENKQNQVQVSQFGSTEKSFQQNDTQNKSKLWNILQQVKQKQSQTNISTTEQTPKDSLEANEYTLSTASQKKLSRNPNDLIKLQNSQEKEQVFESSMLSENNNFLNTSQQSKQEFLNQQYEDYQYKLTQLKQQSKDFYSSSKEAQFSSPTKKQSQNSYYQGNSSHLGKSYVSQQTKEEIINYLLEDQRKEYQKECEQNKNLNIWEHLYQDHKRVKLIKNQNELEKQLQEQKLDPQCTFQPQTTQSQHQQEQRQSRSRSSKQGNLVERNLQWQAVKNKKIEILKQQKVLQSVEECTFQPQINEETAHLQYQQGNYQSLENPASSLNLRGVDKFIKRQELARKAKELKEKYYENKQQNKTDEGNNSTNLGINSYCNQQQSICYTQQQQQNFKNILHQQLHELNL